MRNTMPVFERAPHPTTHRAVVRRPLLTRARVEPNIASAARVLVVADESDLCAALRRHLDLLGFEGLDAPTIWATELLVESGPLSGVVAGPWLEDDHRLELFVFARRLAPEARRIALVPSCGPARVPLAHLTLAPPWSVDALGPALDLAFAYATP